MATLAARPEPRWVLAPADEAAIAVLAAELDCPPAIAHLLVARGIPDRAAATLFFHPSLDHLHDPLHMLGMAPAVARIQQAVAQDEPILIYGDYDVDGTIATVLLKTAIERIALLKDPEKPAKVTWHVPHRIREGYGMQEAILGRAAEAGIRLVISVDTGIRAFAAAAEAKALGLDLIVTDHHLPDGMAGIPEAQAVINPAQAGCPYPFKHLCGAAVAFKLAHALLAAAAVTPEQQARLRAVLLPSFLKLVALATIADSVPLTGENRAIAALGLRELRNPVQPGLRALMEVAKLPLDRSPSAMEVGFRLAPRINAAGRMDIADDVIELFLTRDPGRARSLAEKLDRLNQDRRDAEAEALRAIETRIAALRDDEGELPPDCILLDDPAWHRGVLGILASRVVDRTGRPALVLTHADGHAHGSGRSIEGFHLLDALTAAHSAELDLFTRFGGHAHAVGFSLPSALLPTFRERLSAHAAQALTPDLLCPELHCDAELSLAEITPTLWQWLARCGPFGNAHPEPVFVARAVTLAAPVRVLKEKHICLELTQQDERTGDTARLRALGWSRSTNWPEHCSALDLRPGARLDIVFRLTESRHELYGGLQLELLALRCV